MHKKTCGMLFLWKRLGKRRKNVYVSTHLYRKKYSKNNLETDKIDYQQGVCENKVGVMVREEPEESTGE